MKLRYLLGWVVAAVMFLPCRAQNIMYQTTVKADTSEMLVQEFSMTAGEEVTIFSQGAASSADGCSLIQNQWRDRKVEYKRNGYEIVTANQDEVIRVKNTGGGKKIKYYNDYEWLNYHLKSNGKIHYKYSYDNECEKVKVRRKKNGETSVVNRTEMDYKEIRANLMEAMRKGVNSCSIAE